MQNLKTKQSCEVAADPHPDDQMDEEDLQVAEQSSSQLNMVLDVCPLCICESELDLKCESNLNWALKRESNLNLEYECELWI